MPASGLIDVHHHIVPNEYARALAKLGVTKGLGVRLPKWDVDKSLSVMAEHGISSAIVSISAPGVYFNEHDRRSAIARELSRQTNEICAALINDHPGRFGAFATLPVPDIDAALDELAYSQDELKLNGVILLSNYDGYYLGDARFDELFAELNRRKAVVFIHPQSPPGQEQSHLDLPEAMLDVCFDTTRTAFSLIVNGVTKKYPDIRFILAHAGGAVPIPGRAGCHNGFDVGESQGSGAGRGRRHRQGLFRLAQTGGKDTRPAELLPQVQTQRATRRTRLLPAMLLLRHGTIGLTALLFVAAHRHGLLAYRLRNGLHICNRSSCTGNHKRHPRPRWVHPA